MKGDFVGLDKVKSKAKSKEIPSDWCQPYWLERDRVIYKTCNDEETKLDILKRYNKI